VLKIIRVSKSFGRHDQRVPAVREVTISLVPGEFCALLGHSGAGKSTLLKLINGQLTPDTGQVEVGGLRMEKRSRRSIQHMIGMVHQHYDLVTRLSTLDNVLLGRLPWLPWYRALTRAWTRNERACACRWLERVGLEPAQAQRPAGKLSGGQQQRVAIARAFIRDPRLVLADEPVASLDPETGRGVLELLSEAARARGAAVLCSLHQPEFARAFADRIISMEGGRVVYDGPAEAYRPAATAKRSPGAMRDARIDSPVEVRA